MPDIHIAAVSGTVRCFCLLHRVSNILNSDGLPTGIAGPTNGGEVAWSSPTTVTPGWSYGSGVITYPDANDDIITVRYPTYSVSPDDQGRAFWYYGATADGEGTGSTLERFTQEGPTCCINAPVAFSVTSQSEYIDYWPHAPTVSGHTVSFPAGVWARASTCDLTSLVVDWGDGTVETFALTSTYDSAREISYTIPADSGTPAFTIVTSGYEGTLSSGFSHTFTPDANNNGTGNPIRCRCVDEWGRHSPWSQITINPVANLKVVPDLATGDILLDARDSYGVTGILYRFLLHNGAFSDLQNIDDTSDTLSPSFSDDALGRVFRLSAAQTITAGQRIYTLGLLDRNWSPPIHYYGDTPSGPAYVLETDGQFAPATVRIEHPVQSRVEFDNGLMVAASEIAAVPPYLSIAQNVRAYSTSGTIRFTGFTARSPVTISNLAAPRLKKSGAMTYCAGRSAATRETKLYQSLDFAKSWALVATMWDATYYHADWVLLRGGGGASVALKAVATGSTFKVQIWFRKTRDLTDWSATPVLVTEINSVASANIYTFYAELLDERETTKTPRFLVFWTGATTGMRQSINGGNSWTS